MDFQNMEIFLFAKCIIRQYQQTKKLLEKIKILPEVSKKYKGVFLKTSRSIFVPTVKKRQPPDWMLSFAVYSPFLRYFWGTL
jgi:hypothetical protein